jgi:hypothetical protein
VVSLPVKEIDALVFVIFVACTPVGVFITGMAAFAGPLARENWNIPTNRVRISTFAVVVTLFFAEFARRIGILR